MQRPPRLLAIVLALVLTACFTSGAPDEDIGPPIELEQRPLAMRVPGWLSFEDLALHPDFEGRELREPYLRGWILGGLFTPEGEIVGLKREPPEGRLLLPGWLELQTLAFVAESSDRPVLPPVVRGFLDRETGGFYPTTPVLDQVPEGALGSAEAPAASR